MAIDNCKHTFVEMATTVLPESDQHVSGLLDLGGWCTRFLV